MDPCGTLGDALKFAMEFERSAFVLYAEFAERLDSEARPVLRRLAADSKAHVALLQRHADGAELEQKLSPAGAAWLAAQDCYRSISLPELTPESIEDDLLTYAEVRERLDYDFYSNMARLVPTGALHQVFVGLRDAKQRREGEVRSCCAALFLIF